jgi:hypothetical protein
MKTRRTRPRLGRTRQAWRSPRLGSCHCHHRRPVCPWSRSPELGARSDPHACDSPPLATYVSLSLSLVRVRASRSRTSRRRKRWEGMFIAVYGAATYLFDYSAVRLSRLRASYRCS